MSKLILGSGSCSEFSSPGGDIKQPGPSGCPNASFPNTSTRRTRINPPDLFPAPTLPKLHQL
ncbi:hypothetical protein BDW72DRAFT_183831 [Aspergillus terricola var. indicus]